MTQIDPVLIKRITEAVMAELGRRGDASAVIASDAAAIHAPMGICTGDYSRFPELANRTDLTAAKPTDTTTVIATATAPVPPKPAVFTGMVTARQLADVRGTVYLTASARLTPLAQDLVRERKIAVEIVATQSGNAGKHWLCWMQGHCATAASLITELGGRPLPIGNKPEHLLAAIQQAAGDIRSLKSQLAILFVPAAARAVCFANRCRSLRAVVGTCEQAVQEGIDMLGANVLVLEYPHLNAQRMRQLVMQFIQSSGRPDATLQRQLAQLAACD